jgi:hypothetical protein
MNILSVLVTILVLVIFPVFIFFLFIRAIRNPGTRWWGIVIPLGILTCYCTTWAALLGLNSGGVATGSMALEVRYCDEFREVLKQTETLPEAIARMDAFSAGEEYHIREPEKNLRFRYVWLLGGCFLFAGANLMMFGPGRRERRHAGDCIVMTVAALVVFLTGIWQIAWGNGYAYQASAYRRMLKDWHDGIRLEAIRETNGEIAVGLSGEGEVKSLNGLWRRFRELSGEGIPGMQVKKEKPDADASADAQTGPSVAIIGGADGPTAVFVSSELLKKQVGASAESKNNTNSETNGAAASDHGQSASGN